MKVKLYGRLGDVIGRQIELDMDKGCSVGQLRERLGARCPAACDVLDRSRAVIDSSLVTDARLIGDTEIIEFLPPVSGG